VSQIPDQPTPLTARPVPRPGPPVTPQTDPDPAAELPEGSSGDARVDAALQRLDAIDGLPVADHVEQYDALHRTLQDALATIDEG
jgi:hypothetical protein